MDWDTSEEQQLIQRAARDFAEKSVEPVARDLDAQETWPAALVKQLGELGMLGVAIPEEHGGAGADHVSYALAMEEISARVRRLG